MVRLRQNSDRTRGLQHWVPYVNREGAPVSFQSALWQRISTCSHVSVENFEIALMEAGLEDGTCSNIRFNYQSSAALRQLRHHRRHATNFETRTMLSLQIRPMEKKTWTRWWARCAVLGADLAVLGACYGWVWLCWARSARLGADLALMCMVYIVHVFMSLCLSACVSQVVSWGLSKTKPGIRE